MQLSEIIEQLGVGELSQISFGRVDDTGPIPIDQYPKLIQHINLGLSTLHRRFLLRKGSTVIDLVPGQYLYPVNQENIIKIERILTPEGNEYSLNDYVDPYSMVTPTMKDLSVPKEIVDQSVAIPEAWRTEALIVEYRANHPKIADDAAGTTEVELPYSHLQALLYFVASRVHNPVGMVNEFNMGNNYASKYEQECQRLEIEGLAIDQGGQVNRAYRNGWV